MRNFCILIITLLPMFSMAQDTIYVNDHQKHETVQVIAHKPVVKLKTDKVEYRVSDDVDSKTLTVLDMLRKVPMVTVDGRDNITVNGSSQFLVYVDGRPNQMISRSPSKVLRGMPASNIQRIEVITNPGAKYDAEGVGGVLNIITKKARRIKREEYYGSSHTTAGNNRWGQDLSFGLVNGNWTLDASLMGEYEYTAHNPINNLVSHLGINKFDEKSDMDSRSSMPFSMGEVSIGYQIDTVSVVHLAMSGSYMGFSDKGTSNFTYLGQKYGDGLALSALSDTRFKMGSFDGSLDYQRFFGEDSDGSMTFTYQYSTAPVTNKILYRYLGDSNVQDYAFADIDILQKERSDNHNLLGDFVLPMSEWLKLNSGFKYTQEKGRGESFSQTRNLGALYAEAELEKAWFSSKIGLRREQTWQDSKYNNESGKDFKTHGGVFAPSLVITFSLSESQKLGASYNVRIRRPEINELDPFQSSTDPFTVSYGNPNLDLERTHNLSVDYILNTNRVQMNVTLTHSIANDGIMQYSFKKGEVVNSTYGNIVRSRRTAINTYLSASLTAKTRLFLNSEASYIDLRSKELSASNSGWSFNSNLSLQQTLPGKFKLTTSLEYMSKEHTLQGWQTGMQLLTGSLSKSICDDRWNFALSATTGLGHGGDIVWRSYTATSDFVSDYNYTFPSQSITLGVTYTFGGMRQPKPENPEIQGSGIRRRR